MGSGPFIGLDVAVELIRDSGPDHLDRHIAAIRGDGAMHLRDRCSAYRHLVEAAKQHNGRLYVQTPDSLVSVKGTIFAVESGTKGSRVSVVEGEVHVQHAGNDETLLPGDQATTSPSLDKTSVQQNVAWSRNAARYANLVSDLAKLRRDVNQVARPGVRYSSKFVDLVPDNTVFYAALPNLSETLAESQRIMQERIKQNPALWDAFRHIRSLAGRLMPRR